MKKFVVCLCVVLVLVLLVGCETFGGYSSSGYSSGYSSNSSSSSSSSSGSSSSLSSSNDSTSSSSSSSSEHNSYYVKSYSSNLEKNKTPLSRGDLVLVGVNSGDSYIMRAFELELSTELEELGFRTDVLSNYDTNDINGDFSGEKYRNVLNKTNPDFEILIYFDDVYVFEYGGGISRMSVSSEVWNFKDITTAGSSILISSIVEGKNNYEKYYSSLEVVIEKLTESITNELKQYISN